MNTLLILSIFAIGFVIVWKIRKNKKQSIKQENPTVVLPEPTIEIVEPVQEVKPNTVKRGRKKKVQN